MTIALVGSKPTRPYALPRYKLRLPSEQVSAPDCSKIGWLMLSPTELEMGVAMGVMVDNSLPEAEVGKAAALLLPAG